MKIFVRSPRSPLGMVTKNGLGQTLVTPDLSQRCIQGGFNLFGRLILI